MARFSLLFLVALLAFSVGGHAVTPKVQPLSPEEAVSFIQSREGRHVVVIYTSWCGYCRKVIPAMVALEEDFDGSVVALSMDKDAEALAKYMSKFEQVGFPVVLAEQSYKGHLKQVLKRTGIQYPGHVPYMALIDGAGKVVVQGTLKIEDIEAFIKGG